MIKLIKKKIIQFKNFKDNTKIMSYAKKDCIFLHCLPRGPEVEEKVFFSKQSKVWQQALNRVHVQKSILIILFWKIKVMVEDYLNFDLNIL